MQPQSLQKNLLSCHRVVFLPEVKNLRHQIWQWISEVIWTIGLRWSWYSWKYWKYVYQFIHVFTDCLPSDSLHPQNKRLLLLAGGSLSGFLNSIRNIWCNLLTCLLQRNGKDVESGNREWLIHPVSLAPGHFQSINQSIKSFWTSSKWFLKCCH